MTAMLFLAGWAMRSSMIILAGALLVRFLRIQDATMRGAAWTAMLCGSLLIPVMSTTLPRVNIDVPKAMERPAPMPGAPQPPVRVEVHAAAAIEVHEQFQGAITGHTAAASARPFDWVQAVLAVYILIGAVLLSRVCIGLWISFVLLRQSRTTGIPGVRESDRINAPVTLGITRPLLVLPAGWRDWRSLKLEAVLAHERSHIARWDPAVQFFSNFIAHSYGRAH